MKTSTVHQLNQIKSNLPVNQNYLQMYSTYLRYSHYFEILNIQFNVMSNSDILFNFFDTASHTVVRKNTGKISCQEKGRKKNIREKISRQENQLRRKSSCREKSVTGKKSVAWKNELPRNSAGKINCPGKNLQGKISCMELP